MSCFKVLIPAAGKGSRMNLDTPKSLLKINSKSIISRIVNSLNKFDKTPVIIINPSHLKNFKKNFEKEKNKPEFIYQDKALGMGNAVLKFKNSINFHKCKNLILIWGDIPYISSKTVKTIVDKHLNNSNHFTFPTIDVSKPYTFVKRDKKGKVLKILESREHKYIPEFGEREIGLFVFNKNIVMRELKKNYNNKFNKITKEHSFLYIVEHLVKNNFRVEAVKIATKDEIKEVNTLQDYKDAKKYYCL
jgi:bifunctional UDP-N-acetylglucosamine pyrophosphorylase/glucosamine-1-phosphate N-acetyltransferase